jgi:calcium-activated chloride channel regulator 4
MRSKTIKSSICALGAVLLFTGFAHAATISSGEYTVQVAIDPAMAEDKPFIASIKTMMKNASSYLHKATKQQAIYGKIIILVPDSWSDDPSYLPAGAESVASADIFVGKNIGGAYATPGKIFIDDGSMDGDTVVHEWGHYRWGLGDEYCDYVLKDDGTGAMKWYQVYKTAAGWNRCTALQTIQRDCEERLQSGAACTTTANQVNGAKASIMHRQWNPGIDSFCDNSTDTKYQHNSTVNNHQNRIHGRKSCWEVINVHADGIKMSGGTTISYKDPVFEVKKAGKAEVILVLDVSGSMSGSPIQNAAAAARSFVDRAEEGTWIGVVSFSTSASLLLGLTEVKDAASRAPIKAAIPTTTVSLTCIGCGMQTALNTLNGSPRNMSQMMALLTDGGENVSPRIADVLPSVVAAGVTVNTIGLGAAADAQMQDVADQTGGAYYFAPGGDQQALSDAFITIANQTNPVPSATIESASTTVPGNSGTKALKAYLDSSIGTNTVFNITFSTIDLANAVVTVTQPNGTVLDDSYSGYISDASAKTITFRIDATATVGTWTVDITNNDSSDTTANLLVTSSASSGASPITLTANLASSSVDFPHPAIVRASLTSTEGIILANVYAEVTNPDGTTTDIELKDNGQGADSFPLDGSYAAYYTAYTGPGNYTVRVHADNSSNTAEVGSQFNDNAGFQSDVDAFASEGNRLDIPETNLVAARAMTKPEKALGSDFQRSTSAGGFNLTGWLSGDQIPPSKISTLSIVGQDSSSLLLTWLAVGDDLDFGRATSYDLRISTSDIIDDADFTSANQVTGVSAPQDAGTGETFTVSGLSGDTTYYFAIKAIDDAGNTGSMSNVYSGSTSQGGGSGGSGGGGGGGGGGSCFITSIH